MGSCFLIFTSCSSKLTLIAQQSGGATLAFSSNLNSQTAANIKALTGASENAPLIEQGDLVKLLKDIGGFSIKTEVSDDDRFNGDCYFPDFDSGVFKAVNIIKINDNTITLTMGPEQLSSIYNQLTEETQSYFDMFMAPSLTGEKLNLAEYRALLSSVYGPKIAAEFCDGPIEITLVSPDGTKTSAVKLTLGELMTLTKEKSWSVTW